MTGLTISREVRGMLGKPIDIWKLSSYSWLGYLIKQHGMNTPQTTWNVLLVLNLSVMAMCQNQEKDDERKIWDTSKYLWWTITYGCRDDRLFVEKANSPFEISINRLHRDARFHVWWIGNSIYFMINNLVWNNQAWSKKNVNAKTCLVE